MAATSIHKMLCCMFKKREINSFAGCEVGPRKFECSCAKTFPMTKRLTTTKTTTKKAMNY